MKNEEKWASDGWVANWKRDQQYGTWTEEEARAEHKRDREDRHKSWWGGTEMDRDVESDEQDDKGHRFDTREEHGQALATEWLSGPMTGGRHVMWSPGIGGPTGNTRHGISKS